MKNSADLPKGAPLRWAVMLAPLCVGVAASTSLLVDYLRPAPVFCAADGGCGAVRQTIFASVYGVPLPAIGLAGFLLLGHLMVTRGKLARVLFVLAAAVGALVGAGLLFVQSEMGQFCPYCVGVDGSALVLFGLALHRAVSGWDPPEGRAFRLRAFAPVALSLAVPLALALVLKPRVPKAIALELEKTPAGKITVVDFVDFECPFCRDTHAELSPVLARHKDQIRLVRKHVPLARIHPHAMEAARAACCGEALGKGDELAERLMATPPEELTRDGCAKLAAAAGLDPEGFRRCLTEPATDARIKADSDAFTSTGARGLPTIWVEREKLEGGQDEATLEAAVARALKS